ncbi:RagB/SusD family nutrient uptake outer membrane protein [Faecalibacter rhinopitheci]|uniref:RagB/SusD family nutrient uptake outer membrane protein n=1 Tax=Faecalibacter rhinopitheci TaxID=2779678 RepID=A0A8J7FVC4_9FLAO|nr:RagB/SusD family nutrient uptake outer membrane protein [Faecalibacter rhinopitheci]MBF0596981.1 RagB/SusD family nutrient uptake outer membrane protein [Faecalibacter rhinopitheci]
MKKNIIKSLVLSALLGSAGVMTSCNDAVDIIQEGELNEAAIFTSVSNLEKYLEGDVYSAADPSNEIYLSAVISDEVKPGYRSGGQEYSLHRHFLSSNEEYTSNIWAQHYKLINRVNRLLAGAEKITPTAAETAKYNKIIGEAKALRAWAYVQLSAYFSTDMKDQNALGVILLKDVPNAEQKLPRVTNAEVYALIEEDLAFANSVLSTGADHYRVDLNFVNALQARFNLYKGNYELAKQYANEVISGSGLVLTDASSVINEDLGEVGSPEWNEGFYKTEGSFSAYRNIWNDTARGEIITSFERMGSGPTGNIGSYFNTNNSNYDGSPMWVWGRNLFNIFDQTAGDVRRLSYVDPTALIDEDYATASSPFNSDVLVIDKYPGKTNFSTKNDLKVFRLAEMYLIVAEAEAKSGNLAQANAAVQAIREARNYLGLAATPTYTSVADALKDILKERRVELALEGHRFIDLKRLAIEAGVTMDRNATDDIVETQNLENGSYKYTLPIPLKEISANSTIQQNPGY